MTIQLIGAGLGRTGTMSLKLALERLLDGTCHHMKEVGAHPDEVPIWHAAMRGDPDDYRALRQSSGGRARAPRSSYDGTPPTTRYASAGRW